MKYLNSEELAKLIYLDYKGNNYNGYNFRISNSPTIRTNKEGKILSCTCKRHSIHGDKKPEKVYCRFTDAYKIWQKMEKWNISQNINVQS